MIRSPVRADSSFTGCAVVAHGVSERHVLWPDGHSSSARIPAEHFEVGEKGHRREARAPRV